MSEQSADKQEGIVAEIEFADGTRLAAVPHAPDELHACRQCGAAPGRSHREGCEAEVCPRCGWQLLGCFCIRNDLLQVLTLLFGGRPCLGKSDSP